MGRINTTYFIYLYFPDFDISGLDNITISIPSIVGYSFTPEFYTYNTSGSFITTEIPEVAVVENRLTTSYLKVVSLSLPEVFNPENYSWHIWIDYTKLSTSKVDGDPVYTADLQSIQSNLSMESSGNHIYRENVMNGLPMVYNDITGITKTGGILTDDPIFVAAAVYITKSATYGRLISWGYSTFEAWAVHCQFSASNVEFLFTTNIATNSAGPRIESDWFPFPQGFIVAAWKKSDETMYFTIIDESGNRYDYPSKTGRGGRFSNFRLFDIYDPSRNWGFDNYVGEIFVHNTEDDNLIDNVITYLSFKWISFFTLLDRLKESFYNPVIIQTFSQVDINFLQPQFTGSVNSRAPLLVTTISKVEINGVI